MQIPNSKSQSAMEYLMTYGWAILIIAVVLAALYQLGFFNGTDFVTTSCIAESGFNCQQPVMNTTGYISFNLGQISNGTMTITGVGCTNNTAQPSSFTTPTTQSFVSGQTQQVITQCPGIGNSGRIGTPFRGYIWIKYNFAGQTALLTQVALISITASTSVSFGPPTPLLDQSTNAFSANTMTLSTSQNNEPILIAADGYLGSSSPITPTVTVDGNSVTSITSITSSGSGYSWSTFLFYYIAPTQGTHSIFVQNVGVFYSPYYFNFAISVKNANSLVSSATNSVGTTTTTTVLSPSAASFIFTSVLQDCNSGSSSTATVAWTGSPSTPTSLLFGGIGNCAVAADSYTTTGTSGRYATTSTWSEAGALMTQASVMFK